MKIKEFVEKYCPQYIISAEVKKNLADMFDLPYEGVIEDDDGEEIAVVYTDSGKPLSVMEMVTSTKEDYLKSHPDFEERDLYEKYMESVIILEGEDLVERIRKSMSAARLEVESFNSKFSLASDL